MNDIYVYTGREGKSVRTMKFTRGNVLVALDFNKDREVIGVEVLSAEKVTVDGKTI